jgi:hypothetical protein
MAAKTTQIIYDYRVEDYFIRLDPQPTFDSYYDKYGDDIASWYEEGKVIIIDRPPINFNLELFLRVTFPYQNRKLKKLKDKQLGSKKSSHVQTLFSGDVQLANDFEKEASRCTDQLKSTIKTLCPKYEFTKIDCTWRFSVTHTEDMHLDLFGELYYDHMVRLFWNVDSYPRIWMVGQHISQIVKSKNIDIKYDHPQELNKFINHHYLGETKGLKPTNEPYHILVIPSGSMMMVHTQKIPHCPIIGRRLSGLTCFVNPATMIHRDQLFANFRREMEHA